MASIILFQPLSFTFTLFSILSLVSYSLTFHSLAYDLGSVLQQPLDQSNNMLELFTVKATVVVSQNGSGNFTTITDAVNAAPVNSTSTDGYFVIRIASGIYHEYVSVPANKTYLIMVGDGINKTILTGNHNYVDGWDPYDSYTFAVAAQGFVAVNITFRNTAGPTKQQAFAVKNDADMSAFYRCSFEGYQDTLCTNRMRQFYRECDIYGTVDFIFGNAAAVFQDCNIYLRLPLKGQSNCITAQGRTDLNQTTGIALQNCSLTASADLASSSYSVKSYLGRPWRDYSRTIFMECYIDKVIDPQGWLDFILSNGSRLRTLYYAEYGNRGNGSDTRQRVQWPGYHKIGASEAANFTVNSFISGDDWLPQTGVNYTSGLI